MRKMIAAMLAVMLFSPIFCDVRAVSTMELYFDVRPMVYSSGDVMIYACVRDVAVGLPEDCVGLSALSFDVTYDASKFTLKTEDGRSAWIDESCVMPPDSLVSTQGEGVVNFSFSSNGTDDLMNMQGPLFFFVLTSRSPRSFYNTNVSYPLNFEDISASAYNAHTKAISPLPVDGMDYFVSGYNKKTPARPYVMDRLELIVGEKNYKLDGGEKQSDVAPYIENSRALAPFRLISEAMGFSVEWDQELQQVTAVKTQTVLEYDPELQLVKSLPSQTALTLRVGDMTALVNDTPVRLDVAPALIENRMFLPLRFISESMGYAVDYADGMITITRPLN